MVLNSFFKVSAVMSSGEENPAIIICNGLSLALHDYSRHTIVVRSIIK